MYLEKNNILDINDIIYISQIYKLTNNFERWQNVWQKKFVIYDGRRDSSKKRSWNKLKEGIGYLAEDIDDGNYRVYLTGTDYPPFCICYDFPKRFFYDITQYIHLIPKALFDREIFRREKGISGSIYGEMEIAIYNGRKNRKRRYFWKFIEKGKAYPAIFRYDRKDVAIFDTPNTCEYFPKEFFFNIQDYIRQIPNEIFEAEKARRQKIDDITRRLNFNIKYDYEYNGFKFKQKLKSTLHSMQSTLSVLSEDESFKERLEELTKRLEEKTLKFDLTEQDIQFLSMIPILSFAKSFIGTYLF